LRFARFVVTLQPISKKRLMKTDKKQNQYRTNEQIRVREVRIVGESGSTVMPTRQALDLARQQGVDLVEISPNAEPPVCRLIDYSKFLYQQKKRQKEMKAKQVKVEVKEIRFGPQTDEHDYQFKLKHAQEFLQEGNKVRAYVFFRGRSILFKEQGEVLLLRFANDLEDVGKVESMPSLEGKKMFLYLAPKKAGSAKKSQQARDREAAEAELKETVKQTKQHEAEIDLDTPANGGLLANAKISADALKKLTETESDE
jgi:translation initiation factor IF-3